MISIPKGWRVKEQGDACVLEPPVGPAGGHIEYVERMRPVGALADMVERALDDERGLLVDRMGEPELLVTVEGEYAMLITASGLRDGRPIQLDLGFVLGDDFYARLASRACTPEAGAPRTALVRALLRHDVQLLGLRRRRPMYLPPEGWRAMDAGFRNEWVSPAFPSDPAAIAVWPATPHGPSSRPLHQIVAAQEMGSVVRGPTPARTPRGLTGEQWVIARTLADGSPLLREVVVLADERFTYTLRFDASPDGHEQHRPTFRAVVASLRPIPAPRPPAPPRAATRAVVDHWLA